MNQEERGVTIRQPATANLMIDSADRNTAVDVSPFNFQINRPNSILNGFFNRIGTTEVVLEWDEPNGKYMPPLSTVWSTISTVVSFNGTSYYNAEQALGEICSTISSVGGDVKITNDLLTNGLSLTSGGATFSFFGNLSTATKLGIGAPTVSAANHPIGSPDLRPWRYIDFVSEKLTYNQDLKDSSTAPITRDVLCRWYFVYDNPPPTTDGLGFPIEMGYEPFKLRRLFNPPKQIKWDSRQPVGQLNFQVYGNGAISPIQPLVVDGSSATEWLMTLQVSEN